VEIFRDHGRWRNRPEGIDCLVQSLPVTSGC
jgi:hypothetical protein